MIKRRDPSYTDSSGTRMVERLFIEGPEPVSLKALLVLLDEAGDAEVLFHGASISWERPATVAEYQHSQDYHERRRVATEKWERETLARLKLKYESIQYSETEDMGS